MRQPDMEVVGEAGDGRRRGRACRSASPNVVVMDISMPEMNGLAATRAIRAAAPATAVVALTRHSDDAYVQELLGAGASGYVLKQSASDELVDAVRAAAAGHAISTEPRGAGGRRMLDRNAAPADHQRRSPSARPRCCA